MDIYGEKNKYEKIFFACLSTHPCFSLLFLCLRPDWTYILNVYPRCTNTRLRLKWLKSCEWILWIGLTHVLIENDSVRLCMVWTWFSKVLPLLSEHGEQPNAAFPFNMLILPRANRKKRVLTLSNMFFGWADRISIQLMEALLNYNKSSCLKGAEYFCLCRPPAESLPAWLIKTAESHLAIAV